jgi:hypothetical protein
VSVAFEFNPLIQPRPVRVYDAAPGVVPFARMLQAQNRIRRVEPVDTFEPSSSAPSSTIPNVQLLPKLGEVLPVEQRPETQRVITEQHQQTVRATGRVLDLYI